MASSIDSDGSDSFSNGGSGSAASSNASSTPCKLIVAGAGDAKLVDEENDDAVQDLYSAGDVNGGSKMPVWNKPSNGGALEVDPLMGVSSWPTLSEVAKDPQKSSVESFNIYGEDSMPVLQKQVTAKLHPNFSQNHAQLARRKSLKRHKGNASANNGGSTQPIPPPTLSVSSHTSSSQSNSSSLEDLNLESGQNVVSELLSHTTSDRPKHIFSHRKGNGPQQHGDSSYNNRYGSRKDQDRPNRDRNSQRSFNGRDVRPQPTGVVYSRNIRHIPMPHGSAPYIDPPLSPTMQTFRPPVSYPEFPLYYIPVQPESIRGTGIPNPAPALHHMFMQHFDPELYSKVIHQIDYYFSDENLVKDVYLRSNMDEQGWVPIQLIAGFKKVMRLTANVAFIVEAIRISTVVEVQNDKVRRRNDWMKWLMPKSFKFPSQSTYHDPGSSSEIAACIQKINIEGESSDIPSTVPPPGVQSH